jgi:hypothetical protein
MRTQPMLVDWRAVGMLSSRVAGVKLQVKKKKIRASDVGSDMGYEKIRMRGIEIKVDDDGSFSALKRPECLGSHDLVATPGEPRNLNRFKLITKVALFICLSNFSIEAGSFMSWQNLVDQHCI